MSVSVVPAYAGTTPDVVEIMVATPDDCGVAAACLYDQYSAQDDQQRSALEFAKGPTSTAVVLDSPMPEARKSPTLPAAANCERPGSKARNTAAKHLRRPSTILGLRTSLLVLQRLRDCTKSVGSRLSLYKTEDEGWMILTVWTREDTGPIMEHTERLASFIAHEAGLSHRSLAFD